MKNFPGKLWALPTTLIGIFLGFAGCCIAPRKIKIKFAHNAICFYNHPFMRDRAIALTLGNVILFQKDNDFFMGHNIAAHEKQHTFQAQALGVFYIPLHLICLAVYGRNVMKNPLEHSIVQADADGRSITEAVVRLYSCVRDCWREGFTLDFDPPSHKL